jgi:predicted ATPase
MDNLLIQNFKCFQDVAIPINALTIMAGANGNGKSTAIQALLFLRKTIEENCKIFEEYYITERAEIESNVSLNSGYMLSLGNSGFVLNRQLSGDEIIIGLSDVTKELIVNYQTDITESQLFLKAQKITPTVAAILPILKKEFYYLNAERIGPRVSQAIQFFDFPNAGYQGEFVAQLIAGTNYTLSIETERRHPKNQSPRLEQQVNAWLDELMPRVNIVAKQSIETLTAQIQVENQYTKGDPTLATNIGFGISYVLPIIATGLIAAKGSYMIVENPEAHLHPSAQSKIGRFLSMVAQSGVNVIVETHSDHVINGIQIAAAKKEIDNNSVIINFFSQTEDNPQPMIENITINEKGELSKWPKGFFDQTQIDFAELFKIRKG